MRSLVLRDGREVELKRLTIAETFFGHLEGSFESVSRPVLDQLARDVHEFPRQVMNENIPLARFRCDGYFESSALAKGRGIHDPISPLCGLPIASPIQSAIAVTSA